MSHAEGGSLPRRAGLFTMGLVAGAGTLTVLLLVTVNAINGDPPDALGPPSFVDSTDEAGIEHVYDGDFLYFVGGGVAVFDCDADGMPELYFAGGTRPAGLYLNQSDVAGRLGFERLASPTTDLKGVTGAYPVDVDSDGQTDLAVLRVGENVMLRGLGNCVFERANETWGIDGGDDWTVSFSATWESPDALPTLVFGNYLALQDGERTDSCESHFMFRPDGATYGEPIELRPGWCTLSVLFSDWSRTGRVDLRMTNDRHYYRDGEEQLWDMADDATPRLYTRDEGWELMQIWGMGIASQDVTGDGLPEVFLTSQGDNKLQTLALGAEEPNYEDIALAAGANAPRPFQGDIQRPSTAWHAEFDDVNNDGYLDLFVTKGNVEAMPEFAQQDPNNLLLGQSDGRFLESAGEAGLLDYARSRGAAVADLNLDGLLDVVVVDRREPARVWRNVGGGTADAPLPMGNWMSIQLTQDGSNRNAIGAWIEVRAGQIELSKEITVGGGHAGGELGWVHFGIGDAVEAEVRVIWPDGQLGPWTSVTGGHFWLIDRDSGEAGEWRLLQD